jgi:hypothetical protein
MKLQKPANELYDMEFPEKIELMNKVSNIIKEKNLAGGDVGEILTVFERDELPEDTHTLEWYILEQMEAIQPFRALRDEYGFEKLVSATLKVLVP